MPRYTPRITWLFSSLLLCGFSIPAQSQQPPIVQGAESGRPEARDTGISGGAQLSEQRLPGSIRGTVVDQTGTAVAGARVILTREDQSPNQEALSDNDGLFSFANVAPGPFQVTITSEGFATQACSGILGAEESYQVPRTVLALATAITEVRVVVSRVEVAEDQIKAQEKQRVLGVVPNFYVSYVRDAVPLTPRQKFELAWKTAVDPVSFGINGVVAGLQQAQNDFGGYGQGAQGYAKRYGASYGDFVSSTFIGNAILPSLLKQDPRYFYKGSGRKRTRFLYAIANSVICKGDDGHWQANYSGILGSFAAGGISNLYYPPKDRGGAGLTIENGLIGIGESAAINIFQEFFVRKLTPNGPSHESARP
jgi:hypothetical protein